MKFWGALSLILGLAVFGCQKSDEPVPASVPGPDASATEQPAAETPAEIETPAEEPAAEAEEPAAEAEEPAEEPAAETEEPAEEPAAEPATNP